MNCPKLLAPISTIFPTGIPASFPRQITESSHREPVDPLLTSSGCLPLNCELRYSRPLAVSFRMSSIESLPAVFLFLPLYPLVKNSGLPLLKQLAVQKPSNAPPHYTTRISVRAGHIVSVVSVLFSSASEKEEGSCPNPPTSSEVLRSKTESNSGTLSRNSADWSAFFTSADERLRGVSLV